ncbi:MAG: hypothetical protein ACRD0J_12190, partial [Acidimicrobiales bacterium]
APPPTWRAGSPASATSSSPPHLAWPDWMIAVELAFVLGVDLGFESLEDVWAEVEALAPSHSEVTTALLGSPQARDGVVVPLSSPADRDGPGPVDPMATPGIGAVETDNALAQWAGRTWRPEGRAVPAPGLPRPPLFGPPPPASASATRSDGRLRLVSGRTFYDVGTLAQACPSLAPLAPRLRLRAAPSDLARVDHSEGGPLRVTSARATLVLESEADPGLAEGTVVLAFNSGGPERPT